MTKRRIIGFDADPNSIEIHFAAMTIYDSDDLRAWILLACSQFMRAVNHQWPIGINSFLVPYEKVSYLPYDESQIAENYFHSGYKRLNPRVPELADIF